MHCGVGRLTGLVCLLLLVLAFSAGPAGAYPCGVATSARTLAARVTKADEKDCTPPLRRHRNADPISFAFFVGIIVAVLLVPITLRKREDLPHQ